jgi:low affinity Fe/Cu permease
MWQITWILGLLPDWFWTMVLIAGVLGILASWVLKFIPFVSTYRLPIQVGSIIALLIGVYFQGVIANETKWQNEIAALQKKIDEAAVKSNETNIVVQEKVVTKTKVIKEKGQEIIKYIDKWNTKEIIKEVEGPERIRREEVIKYIENCPVPKEMIDIHNQATELNKAAEGKK